MKILWLGCVAIGCGGPTPNHLDAAAADARPIDAMTDAPSSLNQGLLQLSQTQAAAGGTPSARLVITNGDPQGNPGATDGSCTFYAGGAVVYKGSGGTVDVTATAAALQFVATGTAPSVTYTRTPTTLPNPLFTAGVAVHVTGTGGPDFGSFTANVVGPSSIVATLPTTLSRAGQALTWTAGAGTTMQIVVSTANGAVLCRVPDNGAYALRAATMALLPGAATSGFIAFGRTNETVTGKMTVQLIDGTAGAVTITP